MVKKEILDLLFRETIILKYLMPSDFTTDLKNLNHHEILIKII